MSPFLLSLPVGFGDINRRCHHVLAASQACRDCHRRHLGRLYKIHRVRRGSHFCGGTGARAVSLEPWGCSRCFSAGVWSNRSDLDVFRPARGQSPRVSALGGILLSMKAFCCPLRLGDLGLHYNSFWSSKHLWLVPSSSSLSSSTPHSLPPPQLSQNTGLRVNLGSSLGPASWSLAFSVSIKLQAFPWSGGEEMLKTYCTVVSRDRL